MATFTVGEDDCPSRDIPDVDVIDVVDADSGIDDSTPLFSDDEDVPTMTAACCHPASFSHRLIALFLMCMLGFGSYFCFDNPGALQNEIKDAMDINTYQFASLYSWYSWPNVILPIIGGYLIDTIFGIRFGAIFFAFILIIGQGFFACGGFLKSYILMQVGRFIFGLGGESLAVAQNTYASVWFTGKALNMVFGLQLSIARVGSTVNFQVMGPLYRLIVENHPPNYALGMALAIAGGACIMSFICAVTLGWLDVRASKILKRTEVVHDDVRVKDFLRFPLRFWYLCIICVAYYVAIFPFVSLGQVFYMKKFAMSNTNANFINGLIYLLSAFASPVFGFVIDKTGHNLSYVFSAIVATILGHSLLAFSFLNPYVGVVIIGLSYSLLASALWPITTLIVPHHQIGTAFGLMQAVQNLGLASIAMVSGLIVDAYGYLWLEIFFLGWLSLAIIVTLFLWVADNNQKGLLNMSVKQREDLVEQMKRGHIEESDQSD